MRDELRAQENDSGILKRFLTCAELSLLLALAPRVVFAQVAGSIRGVVYDSAGGTLSNAHVSLKPAGLPTLSDSAGKFRLADLPPGDAVLEVRRLGYRPLSQPVTVPVGSELQLEINLAPLSEELPTVQVLARAQPYDSRLAGFNERKSKHVGYFVTREKLDQMASARFVDALREMPGVSMRTLRGGVVTVSLRGARCAPMFYMDGFPATAGAMDLDMIDLSGVEGIEVYPGMSSIPPEFMTVAGGERCGVIAVWSRPTRPRKQRNAQSEADLERLVASREVYTSDQVDSRAELAGGSAVPVYPDSLWRAGISGRVVAEFVVDPNGAVEAGSVRIISTTEPHFASAVAASLGQAVFRAAVLGGKPVRQLVILPFVFSPQRADSVPSPRN